jgi:hypothetical protein
MHGQQRGTVRGGWRRDLQARRVTAFEQRRGTRGDLEVSLQQPALQEEARRVTELNRVPKGFHRITPDYQPMLPRAATPGKRGSRRIKPGLTAFPRHEQNHHD